MKKLIRFKVNGLEREFLAEPRQTLLDALRWRTEAERLRLEGAEDKARVALFTMGGGR